MKRTLLTMVMAGSCMAVFAQTTPTTPTTPTNPTTPTTTPAPTTTPTTTSPAPATTDPLSTAPTTNMNNPTTMNTSTAWAPGTSPYWGWNNYGIWNSNAATNVNANTATPATDATGSSTPATDVASMNSTASYDAYATAVTALPANVQLNFSKEYPGALNRQYSWNQYGEWFHTHYTNQGRLTQYFYNQRGSGYSLSLPVIQTYVPEDIIDKALQKHGARLYSVSMVKAADSGNVYQLGLLERGQLRMEYFHEDGSLVTNVWRVEEPAADMNSTSTNAAMDSEPTPATTEAMPAEEKEMKTKWKENGVKTKIKSDDGKVKIKQKKVDD